MPDRRIAGDTGAFEWLAEAARKPPRAPYTHVCSACLHRAHEHVMQPNGDLRAGPYCCLCCDCAQPQDGPWVGLTRQQSEDFDALVASAEADAHG